MPNCYLHISISRIATLSYEWAENRSFMRTFVLFDIAIYIEISHRNKIIHNLFIGDMEFEKFEGVALMF